MTYDNGTLNLEGITTNYFMRMFFTPCFETPTLVLNLLHHTVGRLYQDY